MLCPSQSSRFNLTILGERYKLWGSSLWSVLHSPFSSLLGPNTRLRVLFSNTLSLYPSLNVRDHASQPYSTTGNILNIIYYESTTSGSLTTGIRYLGSPARANRLIDHNWPYILTYWWLQVKVMTMWVTELKCPGFTTFSRLKDVRNKCCGTPYIKQQPTFPSIIPSHAHAHYLYCICFDGVVIAAQCTATF